MLPNIYYLRAFFKKAKSEIMLPENIVKINKQKNYRKRVWAVIGDVNGDLVLLLLCSSLMYFDWEKDKVKIIICLLSGYSKGFWSF